MRQLEPDPSDDVSAKGITGWEDGCCVKMDVYDKVVSENSVSGLYAVRRGFIYFQSV